MYQLYTLTAGDDLYRPDTEDVQMLMRPLFTTSFLIDDQLADEGHTARGPILISSASSKTAIATAFRLAERDDAEVVGLTSAGNMEFVEGLDIYDRVVSYDEIDSLERGPAAYVDISGDGAVRTAVHTHFADDLALSMAVGLTHWEALAAGQGDLPGPPPVLFFAPDRLVKRAGDWGMPKLHESITEAWHPFCDWTGGLARGRARRGLRGGRERLPRRARGPRQAQNGPRDLPLDLGPCAPGSASPWPFWVPCFSRGPPGSSTCASRSWTPMPSRTGRSQLLTTRRCAAACSRRSC